MHSLTGAYIVLFAFIPSALSGGIIATLMAIYAYCSATSDKTTRSTRFAIVEICFWIGNFLTILQNSYNVLFSTIFSSTDWLLYWRSNTRQRK